MRHGQYRYHAAMPGLSRGGQGRAGECRQSEESQCGIPIVGFLCFEAGWPNMRSLATSLTGAC